MDQTWIASARNSQAFLGYISKTPWGSDKAHKESCSTSRLDASHSYFWYWNREALQHRPSHQVQDQHVEKHKAVEESGKPLKKAESRWRKQKADWGKSDFVWEKLDFVWGKLDFRRGKSRYWQGSNLQLHGFPILISKLASSGFLPTRIILLTCSRMSLQKQGMNVGHNEFLRHTTISAIIHSKSDILSQRTVHQFSHSWNSISHWQHGQQQITILFQSTAILFEFASPSLTVSELKEESADYQGWVWRHLSSTWPTL